MRNDKIKKDIERIDLTISSNIQSDIEELHDELLSTYTSIIDNFEVGLDSVTEFPAYRNDFATGQINIIPGNKFPQKYIKNLRVIKGKLELLINSHEIETKPSINVNVNNQNTNTNQNTTTIDVKISFEEAVKKINAMDGVLETEMIKEIHKKIEELRQIIESNTKCADKWQKAREIGKWVFDRSVDVGIALLPLFLNIR